MADSDVVEVHGLTIRIKREGCAGFKDCIGIAPDAYELGADGVVRFTNPGSVDRETLIESCRVCPADALIVLDEEGRQIVP